MSRTVYLCNGSKMHLTDCVESTHQWLIRCVTCMLREFNLTWQLNRLRKSAFSLIYHKSVEKNSSCFKSAEGNNTRRCYIILFQLLGFWTSLQAYICIQLINYSLLYYAEFKQLASNPHTNEFDNLRLESDQIHAKHGNCILRSYACTRSDAGRVL